MKIYNSRSGESIEIADGSVVPEGFGLRIPAYLCDGVPIVDPGRVKVRHRPGFVLDAGDDSAARKSYEEMKARNANAWRGPVSDGNSSMWPGPWSPSGNHKPADVSLDSDAQYQAYRVRISNAWKAKPPAAADDIGQSLPRLGGWRDDNPQRPPRDVKLDAAADSDSEAAWVAMVRLNEQAWRGAK